jgi:hypothetical protein
MTLCGHALVGPAQPVELPDDQGVAAAQLVQGLVGGGTDGRPPRRQRTASTSHGYVSKRLLRILTTAK